MSNPYIEKAYDINYSDNEVNNRYKTQLQNVDKWATDSTAAIDNAYEKYGAAKQAELQGNLEYNKYQQELATSEFKDTARDIDTASRAMYNRSGVVNEQMKSSGLSGSGYEETLKGQNQQLFQQKLSATETALTKKIAELQNQYRSLIYQGDVDAAATLMNKIAQAQQINQSIIGYINNLAATSYSQGLSERQFAYDKLNADRNYDLNLDSYNWSKSPNNPQNKTQSLSGGVTVTP